MATKWRGDYKISIGQKPNTVMDLYTFRLTIFFRSRAHMIPAMSCLIGNSEYRCKAFSVISHVDFYRIAVASDAGGRNGTGAVFKEPRCHSFLRSINCESSHKFNYTINELESIANTCWQLDLLSMPRSSIFYAAKRESLSPPSQVDECSGNRRRHRHQPSQL